MRRFTVSLEDETYDLLRLAAADRNPPATLQQMVRYAVEQVLDSEPDGDTEYVESVDVGEISMSEDVAAQQPNDQPEPADLSTFRIGGIWFGLSVNKVEGIAARSEVEQLPTMRHDVAGTIRYRDTLLAVIDGSSRLGTGSADQASGQHLVVRRPDGLIALIVDEVGALVPVDSGKWHALPAGISDDLALIGVNALVDCGDRLVNVLSGIDL